MDFSSQYSALAKLLIKVSTKSVETYFHRPRLENLNHHMAVIDIVTESGITLKGSAISKNRNDAFIRALVELGENLIVVEHGLEDRGGLAGGLFAQLASSRAKYELLERDAFLYHYRNEKQFVPFDLTVNAFGNLKPMAYRLWTADPNVSCFLVTDQPSIYDKSKCMFLGMGAHINWRTALNKAIGEYSIMRLDHEIRPGWCKYLELNPKLIVRWPDFHHVKSRDFRNKLIMQKLTSGNENTSIKESIRPPAETHCDRLWNENRIPSPILGIKYIRVTNKQLAPLLFGKPEVDTGLFHPIW